LKVGRYVTHVVVQVVFECLSELDGFVADIINDAVDELSGIELFANCEFGSSEAFDVAGLAYNFDAYRDFFVRSPVSFR